MDGGTDQKATVTESGLDPMTLVIASVCGCVFITVLLSCICCVRRRGLQRDSTVSSRRDTVPLEDLLSKPTLADPESFFSESPLDFKDFPNSTECYTSNDGTSVGNFSQGSDESTSELVASDCGQGKTTVSDRKSKSERSKRSKNFKTHVLNNELKSYGHGNRRHSDQNIDNAVQDIPITILNDTQTIKRLDEDNLSKNADTDNIKDINNSEGTHGNLNQRLDKNDHGINVNENNDPKVTHKSLDVNITENRVSSESFTSSTRGSISHDMTSSVNVFRLPRQSIVPLPDDFSNERHEKLTLPEVQESPTSPIEPPVILFGANDQSCPLRNNYQTRQSDTEPPSNNIRLSKAPESTDESLRDKENTPGPYSVEIRPRVEDAPRQSTQSNGSSDREGKIKGHMPERISLNLQIDFHFPDNSGRCGNQTRPYVVCSPLSVCQDLNGVSAERQDAIISSSSGKEFPEQQAQINRLHFNDNSTVSTVMRKEMHSTNGDGHMKNLSSPELKISDKENEDGTSLSGNTLVQRNVSVLEINKRFSMPVKLNTIRDKHSTDVEGADKRRFTISGIEIIRNERKQIQTHVSSTIQTGLIDENIENTITPTSRTSDDTKELITNQSPPIKEKRPFCPEGDRKEETLEMPNTNGRNELDNGGQKDLEDNNEAPPTRETKDNDSYGDQIKSNTSTSAIRSDDRIDQALSHHKAILHADGDGGNRSQDISVNRASVEYRSDKNDTTVEILAQHSSDEGPHNNQTEQKSSDVEKTLEHDNYDIADGNSKYSQHITRDTEIDNTKTTPSSESSNSITKTSDVTDLRMDGDEPCVDQNNSDTTEKTGQIESGFNQKESSNLSVEARFLQNPRDTIPREKYNQDGDRVSCEKTVDQDAFHNISSKEITRINEDELIQNQTGNIEEQKQDMEGNDLRYFDQPVKKAYQSPQVDNIPSQVEKHAIKNEKQLDQRTELTQLCQEHESSGNIERINDCENKEEYFKGDEMHEETNLDPHFRDRNETASSTLPPIVKRQQLQGQKTNQNNPPITHAFDGKTKRKENPKGILRKCSLDMHFQEHDTLKYPYSSFGSAEEIGHSRGSHKMTPLVVVSSETDIDSFTSNTTNTEKTLSPKILSQSTEEKSNESDESDYDNPWDSLDDAVKRGSMRYNRRPSRIDGDDVKTVMLKSAEDLGRLLEEAERRRRIRQNGARNSCQILDSPPSPPPTYTFTRVSPLRHTVKEVSSQGSGKDLQDTVFKSRPLRSKKDRQRSKEDLPDEFSRGIDPNRSKTIATGNRSKVYSPDTKKRKGLLHRKS